MTTLTPVVERAIAAHTDILQDSPKKRHFMHSFFCQTSLPYRNVDGRTWSRRSGNLTMHLQAGVAPNGKGEMVPIPLPCGPKSRLILIHLMTEAVLYQSRKISLERTLTTFAKSVGVDTNGRNLRALRDQLQRLAACTVRFAKKNGQYEEVVQGQLCESFKVIHARRSNRSWCTELLLSEEFYASLVKHAVPLDPRAINALKHSAACIDTYLWLAQRLWRLDKPTVIRWQTLHQQLGGGSVRWASWKQCWLGKATSAGVLPQVLEVYPQAKGAVTETDKGLMIRPAPPPVRRFTT